MKRIINGIDTSETDRPVLYPNPARGFVKAELPVNMSGNVNIRIFNSAGMKLSDYEDFYTDGIPLYLNVMDLQGGIYIVSFTMQGTGKTFHGRFILN